MTVALDAPALAPCSVLVLETVLATGMSTSRDLQRSAKLSAGELEAAITELIGLQLVRVERTTAGAVAIRPGPSPQVRQFVRRGGLVPLQARALMDARRSLDWVLTHTGPRVERLTDLDLIVERIATAFERCRHESLNVHHGPAMNAEAMAAGVPFDAELARRGVRVRSVNPVEHLRLEHVRSTAAVLAGHGVQVRFADATPHRILVLDGSQAFVPLDADDEAAGALIVAEPAIVGSLRFLANALFAGGVAAPDVAAEAVLPAPTALDRRVLELMNSGGTDTAAAKRLGVTERQFRRYVAKIMDGLGATSRFQAGVRAVERGWL